jgi:WD40 repeat protein
VGGGSYIQIVPLDPNDRGDEIRVLRIEEDGNLKGDIAPEGAYSNFVTTAALSTDEHYLVAGTREGFIMLYDLVEGGKPVKLEGHTNTVVHMAFNSDGTKLVSADADGVIFVWRMASRSRVTYSQPHSGPIEGLIFRADGNISAWNESTSWLISSVDGRRLHGTLIYTGAIYDVSPATGDMAIYNPRYMELWSIDGAYLQQLGDRSPKVDVGGLKIVDVFDAEYSMDGNLVAIAGSGGIWIEDLVTGQTSVRIESESYYDHLTISQDGHFIAACKYPVQNCLCSVFDVDSGEALFQIPSEDASEEITEQYRFSPVDQQIGVVANAIEGIGLLHVWDFADGTLIDSIEFPGERLTSLAFSPNGWQAVVGTADGKILVVDLFDWKY